MIPHEALTGPMVWDAGTLSNRPLWNTTLEPDEIEAFRTLLTTDATSVGPALTARMQSIQEELEDGCGAVRIRQLPIDLGDEAAYARTFQKLAGLVGILLPQTTGGDTIFRVEDAKLPGDSPKARGPNTRQALSFHSDRCDVISFLCMRQAAAGGDNLIVSTAALHNEILRQRPDLLETLYEKFPWKRHTFDQGNQTKCAFMPVFSIHDGYFASNLMRILILRADEDPTLPNLSPLQREALDFIEELALDPIYCVRFRQEPGDLVFLNNFITLHSRTEFTDATQGRLIFRTWLSVPNSRPLAPCWSANYGNTEAGALRGGIREK